VAGNPAHSGDEATVQQFSNTKKAAVAHRLALLLRTVAVDGRRWEAVAGQEVLQRVRAALGLHKHEREALRTVKPGLEAPAAGAVGRAAQLKHNPA